MREVRVRRKREIFDYYRQALGHLPGIDFIPEAPWGRSTRWLTVITIDPEQFGVTLSPLHLVTLSHLPSGTAMSQPDQRRVVEEIRGQGEGGCRLGRRRI